jgi:enoyl-CoA hydratase/carnithine racemase
LLQTVDGEHIITEQSQTNSATEPLVETDRPAGGVLVATLDCAHRRNSLSRAMMQALSDALALGAEDESIKAIIVAAAGPAFSAGHDLKELTAHRQDSDRGREFYQQTMAQCSTLMQTIVTHPKPVIAAVEGMATAAGCQLVASCDLAVAGKRARFCTPGVNIGLFCSTPMVALSRNLSRKAAMEMLLTGDIIDAETADKLGLVNRVVDEGQAGAEALSMASRIAEKSAQTIAIGKKAFYAQLEMPLAEAYQYASDVMVQNMLAADAKEGIAAFLEKRQPTWGGTDEE